MSRFQTLRQRRHRATRGQVSALVTVLGLLLVVTFIANFVILQLPGQMAELEFAHTIQVENQLSRLQATILAEATEGGVPVTISTPVTLGSQGAPPFGPPSTGVVGPEPSTIASTGGFIVTSVASTPPRWNAGSACLPGGSGTCATNANVDYYNLSGLNRSSITIKVTGNNNTLFYNITGNNDSITVTWNGKDAKSINVVVNGSDNTVSFIKTGTDTTPSISKFFFFGQNDVFNYNPTGSKSTGGSQQVQVTFAGTHNQLCPYGNRSGTDTIGTLTAAGKNINLTVTWWNSNGYVTPAHSRAYPGGVLPTEKVTWSNQSGFLACAFTHAYSRNYLMQYAGGLDVHLNNRYTPQADVAYDQGAVILGQSGGSPVMISPPLIRTFAVQGGVAANITLVNVLGNISTQAGVTTAAITTRVVAVSTFILVNGQSGASLGGPFYLNVTTLYPGAWIGYFAQFPQAFPAGSSCFSAKPIPAPATCATPPSGTVVTVVAPMFLQEVQVTEITVQVSID